MRYNGACTGTRAARITIFCAYGVLITWLSLRPGSGMPVVHWDKVAHVVTYAVFAAMGYRLIRGARGYAVLCLGIVAYSVLIEVAQALVPGRVMSGYDMVANAVGAAAGASIMWYWYRIKPDHG